MNKQLIDKTKQQSWVDEGWLALYYFLLLIFYLTPIRIFFDVIKKVNWYSDEWIPELVGAFLAVIILFYLINIPLKKIKRRLIEKGSFLPFKQYLTHLPEIVSFYQNWLLSNTAKKKRQKKSFKAKKKRQKKLLADERLLFKREPLPCLFQGGTGIDFTDGMEIIFSCRTDCICLLNLIDETSILIPYTQLTNLEIDGPGKKTSNLGIIGGGFGAESAAKGVLVASVINLLTTVSTTNTFLRIGFSDSEVLLHFKNVEPSDLRIILSPAYTELNKKKTTITNGSETNSVFSLSGELKNLDDLRKDNILSAEEFAVAKQKLLTRER